jgi:hypothetical protein
VDPATKDCKDGENIVAQLSFGRLHIVVENQEFATGSLDEILNDFAAEPRKTVSVGNHNRELCAAKKSVQYGSKALALEVESGSDILFELRRERGVMWSKVNRSPAPQCTHANPSRA